MADPNEEAKLKAEAEAKAKAAEAKADAEAKAKAHAKYLAEERKTLTRMVKDGEETFVHPTTVKSHEVIGWKVAAE